MQIPSVVGAVAAGLLVAGLGLSAYGVIHHERGELEHESPPATLTALAKAAGATRVSARLTEVELQRGERVLFELCSEDQLRPELWRDALEVAVFRLPQMELMLRVPLDTDHLATARRGRDGACLPLGGGLIERPGRHSFDLVWPAKPPRSELQAVALHARVLGLRSLSLVDRAAVITLGLGALLLIAALMAPRTARSPRDDPASLADSAQDETSPVSDPPPAFSAMPHAKELLLGAAAVAALVLATRVPSAGATSTFAKGLALVLIQAGAALWLMRAARPAPGAAIAALALVPPPGRPVRWLGIALLSAAALVASARLALRLVPATGEAPIQTFVSWPSGMLCFAALGVLLPLGEELFFRGYLYRVALGFGRTAAFALTFGLFLALHAEQSWGNWGGLVSVGMAGLLLTALRVRSGSVLIPALAHVLYNFTLSMTSF